MTERLFLYPFIISVQCVSGSYFTSQTQRMRSAATFNYTTRRGIVLRLRAYIVPTLAHYKPRVQKVGWYTYTDIATTLLLLWIIINQRIMGYLLTESVRVYKIRPCRNGGERVYGELIPSRWLKIMPRYTHPSPNSWKCAVQEERFVFREIGCMISRRFRQRWGT